MNIKHRKRIEKFLDRWNDYMEKEDNRSDLKSEYLRLLIEKALIEDSEDFINRIDRFIKSSIKSSSYKENHSKAGVKVEIVNGKLKLL